MITGGDIICKYNIDPDCPSVHRLDGEFDFSDKHLCNVNGLLDPENS